MENHISQETLQDVLNRTTQEITKQVAGIRLHQASAAPSAEICTVHADFNRGFYFGLSLCADVTLFNRLTQHMMQQEEIERQDMEDFVKEYFNVLCGHIAAGLFQTTKVASRFGAPSFHNGYYLPDGTQKQIILCYASDRNESVQLTHHQAVG